MSIEGRVFAVTGASGNLGHATAELLLARGARVLLLDRDTRRAREAFAAELASGAVRVSELDLADEASTKSAIDAEHEHRGRFDGIVCTVGGYMARKTSESPWSDWEAMFAVNVKATVICSRAVLPTLLASGRGSIVHVASLAALSGIGGQAAYSAAKSAVLRFTESLAEEVKSAGVRVNAVLPGTLDTPQNRAWMSPKDVALALDPKQVAQVIAFLLSDDAAAVNGAAVRVTGRQ